MLAVVVIVSLFAFTKTDYDGIAAVATAATPILLAVIALVNLKMREGQKVNTREIQKIKHAQDKRSDVQERDEREA